MADLLSDIGSVAGAALGSVPGGALISGGLNLLGGMQQIQGQQQSIQQQENYQTQMSDTAYTRGVADMKNAGLNPALMYGSGGPESTPSGASMTPPSLGGAVSSGIQSGVATGLDVESTQANVALKNLDALTASAKLPIFDAEGNFVKALIPAMNALEGYLQTSATGIPTLGKAISSGMNSVQDFADDSASWFGERTSGDFLSGSPGGWGLSGSINK